jgi:DNA polymerase
MPDAHRIVRQWLETDAAFGAAEVPLAAAGRASAPPALPARAAPAVSASRQAVAAALARPPVAAGPTVRSAPSKTPTARPAAAQDSLIPGTGSRDVPRKKTAIALPPAPAGNIADLPPITRKQKETLLAKLHEEVTACCTPYLNDISKNIVFGEGDPDAEILFVGEGPGVEEDKTGRPFVGRSGQLLDKMIGAMGYTRDGGGVYIANVVKMRCADWDPAGTRLTDRPPTPEEVARGLPLLHKQIEIIRPKVIVTLGAPAVKYLTGTTEGVMKIRGTWLSYRGVPVMPTYHPSFVLRADTPENRRKVWSDLQEALNRAKSS